MDPNLSAVFTLNVCNDAAESRTYVLELTNNGNGANVSVANTPLNNVNNLIEFPVASGSCDNPLLTIGRNPSLPESGQNGYLPVYDIYSILNAAGLQTKMKLI